VLKGLDQLYASKQWLNGELRELKQEDVQRLLPRLSYIGERLSFADVASLYHLADCYVAPYLAEGFNLPALEAAASGLHVICTAGGPTDDFVTDAFARRIRSTLTPVERQSGDPPGFALIPSFDDLVQAMLDVIERPELRQRARSAGPAHVAAHFTWERVVDRLLGVMLAQAAAATANTAEGTSEGKKW
jgi:glycosyltransferase involved in cell wall biosynthesis